MSKRYVKPKNCSFATVVLENGKLDAEDQAWYDAIKAQLKGTAFSLRVRGRKPTADCPHYRTRNHCGDIPVKFANEADIYIRVNYGTQDVIDWKTLREMIENIEASIVV